jgi:hypothetical protein
MRRVLKLARQERPVSDTCAFSDECQAIFRCGSIIEGINNAQKSFIRLAKLGGLRAGVQNVPGQFLQIVGIYW